MGLLLLLWYLCCNIDCLFFSFAIHCLDFISDFFELLGIFLLLQCQILFLFWELFLGFEGLLKCFFILFLDHFINFIGDILHFYFDRLNLNITVGNLLWSFCDLTPLGLSILDWIFDNFAKASWQWINILTCLWVILYILRRIIVLDDFWKIGTLRILNLGFCNI